MTNRTEYYSKGKRYVVGIGDDVQRRFVIIEINIKTKPHKTRIMDELGNHKTAADAQAVLDDYSTVQNWKTC